MNRHLIPSLAALLLVTGLSWAHPGHGNASDLRLWREAGGVFEASFSLERDGQVCLVKHDGAVVWVPLDRLSEADREWVRSKRDEIARMNGDVAPVDSVPSGDGVGGLVMLGLIGFVVVALAGNATRKRWSGAPFAGAAAMAMIVGIWAMATLVQDASPAIQKHFEPFKDKLKFRSDSDWFYVESNGMPDHPMMVGIRAWQQQVPIPQNYNGSNAWQIPLHPKMADKPVSAKSALFRGAIALAVNGVPIFNPIKNDGRTDTFTAGELDQYGGHCGKGDDYHYHIAPVHLEKIVGKGNPIGYALDGYPLYGYLDQMGKEPRNLDAFNGRMEKDGYKYYSTKQYPYVNGGLKGVVTVRNDQVDPQPRANPIRPEGRPLRGAKITGFSRDDDKKTVKVVYELSGKAQSVQYTAKDGGTFDFVFTDGAGRQTTESYKMRGGDGKKDGGGKKDAKGGKKDAGKGKDSASGKKDGEGPRLPWIAAHFEELDTNMDGKLTIAELKAEVDKTFAGFDKDKDGKLTKDEYSGRGANVKSALAGFVKGHHEEFADPMGNITKEGFLGFMTRMFNKSDKSGSGTITKADASRTGGGKDKK